MLELIKGFVAKVVDPRDIVKSNAEILVLRHPGTGEKSIVNSYPAASKTLRGSGGDVLWLEEGECHTCIDICCLYFTFSQHCSRLHAPFTFF